MTVLRKIILALFCLCFLAGCYEDEVELTLNPDGSGILKQKLVLSERLVVASSDSSGSENTPPVAKEKMVEEIGSAVDITSIKQTDLRDGARVIEFEGTFRKPEQFFLSEFCQKTIKLRLAPAGDSKAAIYCDMKKSSDGGPNLTQLYGMAKGLYVNRTVHLPSEIEKTNGQTGKAKNTVSWVMDLRDKDALARTKAFIEGPDEGKGFAVFDASGLKFNLPLKVATLPEKAVEAEKRESPRESTGLAAKVSWVSLKKKMRTDGIGTAEISDLEIGIELSWNEGCEPVACRKAVLLTLLDDQSRDLVPSKQDSTSRLMVYSSERKGRKKELTLKAETPSKNARKLTSLSGYVEVITGVVKQSVVLENIRELAGKEATGNAILDRLNFRIKSITGHKLKIEVDGGSRTITSLKVLREDGSGIRSSGGMGGGNEYTYEFDEDIPKLAKCELEVIVSEDTVRIPFSLEEMLLP
jgi:hypothetical protein